VAGIAVHVIGAGYGETIVVEFPDGTAGVIDPFCGDTRLNEENRADVHPIIRFLEHQLKVGSLRFVALTHPHADHCMGFGQFIDHFTAIIEELWVPDAWFSTLGRKYLAALKAYRKCDHTEEEQSADPGTILNELERIEDWMVRHPDHYDFIKSGMVKPLDCGGESLEFVCYAPDAQAMRKIGEVHSQILREAQSVPDRPWDVLRPEKLPSDGRWNLISTVILLRWRQVEFLFCGDAEEGTWNRILGTPEAPKRPSGTDWRVNLVKIGHHGSHTGLNDRLYDYLAGNSNPIGVLTPFCRIRRDSRLPTLAGIGAFSPNLFSTYTTCWQHSLHAGSWEQSPDEEATEFGIRAEELDGVLERYLREYPSLVNALRSASLQQLEHWLASPDAIPAEILEEVEVRPELADSFHPVIRELLLAVAQPDAFSIENQFRVSHRFDDTGELQYCELGTGTGKLTESA